MDFTLSDEQAMLKTLVERFVADRYDGGARARYRAEADGYAERNWARLAELGLLSLPFSEADGGLAAGAVEIATVMEALGAGLATEPIIDHLIVGGGLLAAAGTPVQKAAWIGRIIAGKAHVALAHAEHGQRYDLDRMLTRFVDGAVSGRKTIVPGGADAWLVTALDNDTPGLFLVARDAPGVTRRDYRLIDGSVACELQFDATPAERMAGTLADLEAVFDRARIAAAAEMVGVMTMLFAATLDYVRQRRQFGVAIGTFQVIQHRLADQYAALEQSRSQLYRAMLTEESVTIAAAKSYISAAAIRLGEACIQMHGGMGVSDELDIGHGHKRIVRLASLFGDADYELARYDRARREAA